jgi:hypothetical protein
MWWFLSIVHSCELVYKKRWKSFVAAKSRRRAGTTSLLRAFAQLHSAILIHPQHAHCGSAHGRSPSDFSIAVDKVIFPIVQPWMIQARYFSISWINAGKIYPFAQIAMMTGERQIIRYVFATVPPGNNVFDVK